MEGIYTREKLVATYKSSLNQDPEDRDLHIYRRENLKHEFIVSP
jgi:hypothetical protein